MATKIYIYISKLRISAHHRARKGIKSNLRKRLSRFELSAYRCINIAKIIFFGSELHRC